MKFKSVIKRERKTREFDPNRTMTRAGKTFVVHDLIQEAKEDCEIYTCLEKYGTLEKMPLNAQKVYGEFGKMMTLRDIMDQQNEAKRLWNDLPYDIRMKFNNNIHTFIKEGEGFLKAEAEKQTAPDLTQATSATIENTATQGESNGQK